MTISKRQTANKFVYIIIAIIFVVMLVFFLFKSPFPKRLLNHFNKDLIEQRDQLKKEKEQLIETYKQDSIQNAYLREVQLIKTQEAQQKYNNALQKLKFYEKALYDYRAGNYLPNFSTFTKNLTSPDTIPDSRFNTDN